MKNILTIFAIIGIVSVLTGCSTSSKQDANKVLSSSVFKSLDGGKKWEPKGKATGKISMASLDVLSLAINPFDGNNIFVGTAKNGIIKTDNGGEEWTALNYPAEKVYGLAIDNTQSQVMYATGVWQGYGKIFKSKDSGKEWDEIYTTPSKGPLVISLIMDKLNPNVLFASTSDRQVIKTSDGGASWQKIYEAPGPVAKIAFDSANQNQIYLLVSGMSLFKSSDGGKNFERIADTLGQGIEAIETDPVLPNVIYAGGTNGLKRSVDGGKSFNEIQILNDARNFPVRSIAINPSNSQEIVYGAAQAVYKTIDGGKTWSPFQMETKKMINIIRYDPNNVGMLYLGLRDK